MTETIEAMHRSRIRPRVELFAAADAKKAFRKLAEKKAIGKLVIDFSHVSAKL